YLFMSENSKFVPSLPSHRMIRIKLLRTGINTICYRFFLRPTTSYCPSLFFPPPTASRKCGMYGLCSSPQRYLSGIEGLSSPVSHPRRLFPSRSPESPQATRNGADHLRFLHVGTP